MLYSEMVKLVADYHDLLNPTLQAQYAEFEAFSELFELAETLNWKPWRKPQELCLDRSFEEAVDAFIAMRGFVLTKKVGVDISRPKQHTAALFKNIEDAWHEYTVFDCLKECHNTLIFYRYYAPIIDSIPLKEERLPAFYLCLLLKVLILSFPNLSKEAIFKRFEHQLMETIQNNKENKTF